MTTPERDEDGRTDAVEEAGETTAADTIEGPADTRPVGAGTLVGTAEDGDGGGDG